MPTPEDNPRLFFLSVEKAVVPPPGIIEHIKDHWWSVHPTKGLIFWDKRARSPQANSNEDIARRLQQSLYPWAECRFIPSVFRKIDIQDYCGH
jgi:hypothetical protein